MINKKEKKIKKMNVMYRNIYFVPICPPRQMLSPPSYSLENKFVKYLWLPNRVDDVGNEPNLIHFSSCSFVYPSSLPQTSTQSLGIKKWSFLPINYTSWALHIEQFVLPSLYIRGS